jgi:hypothetical protein
MGEDKEEDVSSHVGDLVGNNTLLKERWDGKTRNKKT